MLSACPQSSVDDDDAGSDDDDAAMDDDDASDDDDAASDDDDAADDDDDDDDDSQDPGPLGWIGSPCESSADCDFDGAVCLTEDFPGGVCTQVCDLYCPDRAGHPVTFCVDTLDLPASAELGDGDCMSRCDFSHFPDSGCRPGWSCQIASRANEPNTDMFVCLPGDDTDLSSCHFELAERGVGFEPTIREPDTPDTHPWLDCIIEDPVYLKSPVLGLHFATSDGTPDDEVLVSCETARALADTAVDVLPFDAVTLLHMGTYNCRVISGTDTLSEHAFANAIDIYGFEMATGDYYTLVADWEHNTSQPSGQAAQWLYEAAHRWDDEDIWNIILTPNYNAAHDNHFHVDKTPGADYLGVADGHCGAQGLLGEDRL